MQYPKLVIASDGAHTVCLLDGVCIGQGIERLDFSTEQKNGEMKATVRIMDLDVTRAKISPAGEFDRILESMFIGASTAPAATGTVEEVRE